MPGVAAPRELLADGIAFVPQGRNLFGSLSVRHNLELCGITLPRGELSGRVLLVDDLADSGVTLAAVAERLRGLPAISELRSAVLWTKAISTYTPDYFVEVLPTSPWIHQPFEDYDGISIETLIKRNAEE